MHMIPRIIRCFFLPVNCSVPFFNMLPLFHVFGPIMPLYITFLGCDIRLQPVFSPPLFLGWKNLPFDFKFFSCEFFAFHGSITWYDYFPPTMFFFPTIFTVDSTHPAQCILFFFSFLFFAFPSCYFDAPKCQVLPRFSCFLPPPFLANYMSDHQSLFTLPFLFPMHSFPPAVCFHGNLKIIYTRDWNFPRNPGSSLHNQPHVYPFLLENVVDHPPTLGLLSVCWISFCWSVFPPDAPRNGPGPHPGSRSANWCFFPYDKGYNFHQKLVLTFFFRWQPNPLFSFF